MADIYDILVGSNAGRVELVPGMSWQDYRATVAMNPSSLVHGLESMKKLLWEWENPSPSTAAMAFGTACHTLCFEPKSFEQRYAFWSGGSRRTKEYREFAVDAWERGEKVLTAEEFEAVQRVALSLTAHEEVQGLIRSGKPEVSMFWSDCGVQCKGRVDWIAGPAASREALVDLKTANDVSERGRGRAFFRYHYDVKLGLYQRAIEKITGRLLPVCVVWVENKPPYDVVIDDGWIPQAVLDAGVEKALAVLRTLRRSLETRHWPGHGGPLWVPAYAMEDEIVEWHDDEN